MDDGRSTSFRPIYLTRKSRTANYLVGHNHFGVPVVETTAEHPHAEFLLGDMMENFNKHYFSLGPDRIRELQGDDMCDFLAAHVPQTQKNPDRRGIFLNQDFRHEARKQYQAVLAEFFESLDAVSDEMSDRLDCLLRWSSVSLTYTYNMFLNIWPFARERNIYFDNDLDNLSLQIPSRLRTTQRLHLATLRKMGRRLHWIADANHFLPPGTPMPVQVLSKRVRPMLGRLRRRLARRQNTGAVLATSGSWLLTHEMYRHDQRYRSFIADVLTDSSNFPDRVFDHSRIVGTWQQYLEGNRSLHFEIEGLLTLGLLLRRIQRT